MVKLGLDLQPGGLTAASSPLGLLVTGSSTKNIQSLRN